MGTDWLPMLGSTNTANHPENVIKGTSQKDSIIKKFIESSSLVQKLNIIVYI